MVTYSNDEIKATISYCTTSIKQLRPIARLRQSHGFRTILLFMQSPLKIIASEIIIKKWNIFVFDYNSLPLVYDRYTVTSLARAVTTSRPEDTF